MTLETARLDIRDMLDPVLTAVPQQALFNLVSNAIKFSPP
jgi:signal transduction histidine kinase